MAEELTKFANALPANIEDLSTFVFVGREKLVSLQAELRAMTKVGMVAEVRQQKLSEAQDLADELLLAEVRLGELISELPEMPGKRTDLQPMDNDVQKSKKEVLQEIGLSIKTAQRYERLAKHPEIVASMSAEARSEGDIVSRASVLRAITQSNKPYISKRSIIARISFTIAVCKNGMDGNISLSPFTTIGGILCQQSACIIPMQNGRN